MQSKAATVSQYLAELPDDRRAAISAVRDVIRASLDPAIEECMNYGMIGYVVPHRVYPAGYHCDPKLPLPYLALASQKGHMSLYLMNVYCGCGTGEGPGENQHAQWFRERWARTGKKLDMGKACIRFKKLDDLALDVIAEAIARVPAAQFIAHYEAGLAAPRPARKPAPAAGSTASKPPAKRPANRKMAAEAAATRPAARKSADHPAARKRPA